VFDKHDQAGSDGDPVVMVSYNEARFVRQDARRPAAHQRRVDSAVKTPGFHASGDLLEWVESPDDKKLVRQGGKAMTRPDTPQKDITFRMAKQL